MESESKLIPSIEDDDGIPIGWEDVRLTEQERNALWDAVERGDQPTAEEIVEGAYARLFGEQIN